MHTSDRKRDATPQPPPFKVIMIGDDQYRAMLWLQKVNPGLMRVARFAKLPKHLGGTHDPRRTVLVLGPGYESSEVFKSQAIDVWKSKGLKVMTGRAFKRTLARKKAQHAPSRAAFN